MMFFQGFLRKKVFLLLFCVNNSQKQGFTKICSGMGITNIRLFVNAFYGLDSSVFVVVNLTNFNRAEPRLSTRRD